MPISRLITLAALLLGMAPAAAQVARIENTATLTVGATVIRSNTVSLDIDRAKRPTALSFRALPVGVPLTGLSCVADPELVGTGAPIDAETLARARVLDELDVREPVIMALTDVTANTDPSRRETTVILAQAGQKREKLILTETAPDSGVFAGAFPEEDVTKSADQAVPCDFRLARGEAVILSVEEDDDSLASSAGILVDPAGTVFDSVTGELVDGAEVTLLDDAGNPAEVYGEDGVTRYPATVVTGAAVVDAAGRVHAGRTGSYQFPQVAPGQYHLHIVPPGRYTAPSDRTPGELAALAGTIARPLIINDASYLRAFAVVPGVDFIADVPLDQPIGAPITRSEAVPALILDKAASVREAAPGDRVEYRLRLRNPGKIARTGLHLKDVLPAGVRYRRGSTRGVVEPVVSPDGATLDFALPSLPASGTLELRYVASIAPGAPVGESVNRARVLDRDTPVSNEATATVRLQPLLFTDAITVVGRVTEGACGDPDAGRKGVGGVRLLLEDGTVAVTDRDGLYHLEGVRAGRHVVQLDTTSLPATHQPVTCDADTRQAGSATSRFVEGVGGTIARIDFQLRPTGAAARDADTLPIVVEDEASAAGARDWLTGQAPGIAWLFPAPDHNPRTRALRVAIKHAPGQRVALSLNGQATDALWFDATDTAGPVAVSRWSGIPLTDGDNRLTARVLDAEGRVVTSLERVVHVAGAPAHAMVDPSHSRLVADGLTRPLIAVRVTDRAGRPVRAGTAVPFTVEAPYLPATAAEREQGAALAGRASSEVSATVVGDEGYAFLALQPTTRAGAVRATVTLAEGRAAHAENVRAWLASAGTDWTLVGFGAGTIGHDTLSRHLRSAKNAGSIVDGQLALYAKGRIRGSWLLTLAYDSARRRDPDRGLLGVIDPDRYYTVYGDGSLQAADAPSRGKLYLRLERREAYALFGDFESGLVDTQLARFSRTLSGVKAAYEGEHLRATGFAAESDARHLRDEIRGNGLTGPYTLSARGIVPNSDKLLIETRDRVRSERIVSQTAMTRHLDYDIDSEAGTIRFRSPVLSRDPDGNPIVIVVDYEVDSGRTGKLVAAGRIAARAMGGRVEMGASAIRDETLGRATVIAADLAIRPVPGTELRAEAAFGGAGGLSAGRAMLAEVEHHGGGIDVLAYLRQQDLDFGVGQQNAVEAGTRKIGLEGRVAINDRLSLAGTAWQQAELGSDGTRAAADLRLEYRRPGGTLFVGAQLAEDRGLGGQDRRSRLLTLGGSQALLGGKLSLAGQTGWAPGGDKGSAGFPVRHQVTAAYRLTHEVRVIGSYELAEGFDRTARSAQLGFEVAPWTGGKLTGALNRQGSGENEARSYAQYGIAQSLRLGARWTVDATLDVASRLARRAGPEVLDGWPGQNPVVADGTAATVGAGYRADRWSWNGRLEHRRGEDGSRWVLTSTMLRSLGEGRTLAASGRLASLRDPGGALATQAAGDLALALRPIDSRWSVLERFSLRHDRADAGIDSRGTFGVATLSGVHGTSSRAINNLAINYRTGPEGRGHGLEASLYYGVKYLRGRFESDRYDGVIDTIGFGIRRDLGRRLDIGVQGSVQHAWSMASLRWSGGPSIGLSPAGDLWISAGVNLAGYRDADAPEDRYTRAGPYLTMRMKVDRNSIGNVARFLAGGRR